MSSKLNIGLIGIVGEEAREDFWGTMEKVAAIGYRGIEGAEQLLEGDTEANVARFHGLGLEVLTCSASREQLRDNLDTLIANAKALHSKRVTVWWAPCDSRESVLADAKLYNEAGSKLAAAGIKLCYHNHGHEFRNVFNGVNAMDLLAEYSDPAALFFEMDIAWISHGGADPVYVLRKLAGRVPAIHVKDMHSYTDSNPFTAVGTGIVNVRGSIAAAMETGVEWMVVEQDRMRHLTPFETATVSYLNLKEAGLV
ncbi:sugar phosphate isomerase/epimerase family protein [Paenibacillus spongiae]|uniref:Sugar phosphate isomerase/epimerase n=1 Tax=Paenibacillus spongiae TaxID=2909671 RepID=A0ABY5SM36_9BACL|nr:sugar phosphate isomerase/epimerase [Paenibacillus spongiae]UVI33283.1 sugar phosphate isomerase/epimerase [Paenibacillus spongiae]